VSAVEAIASDNTSGAAEILPRAVEVFTLLEHELSGRPPIERAQEAVLAVSVALARSQPAMSPLIRLSSAALVAARSSKSEPIESAARAAAGFVQEASRANITTATNAAGLIGEGARLLTHSRSSTVLDALRRARRAGKYFSVVVTESRPLLEGRTLAQALVDEGAQVTLVADAAAGLAMQETDLVLIGADAVTAAKVVNKIGSRMIALAAQKQGIPIYVLCDTSKFIGQDLLALEREHSGAELWAGAPEGLRIVNRYFESAPLDYFTGIVCEDGVLSATEAARRADEAAIDEVLAEALSAGASFR
jgi:translation initiation factor eIF-2B subunit delta